MSEKTDEEIIVGHEGDITINMKELKTSLPKLVDELSNIPTRVALKKLMLAIAIRLEIIQHTLKPVLVENSKVLSDAQKYAQDVIKSNENVMSFLGEIKRLMEEDLEAK